LTAPTAALPPPGLCLRRDAPGLCRFTLSRALRQPGLLQFPLPLLFRLPLGKAALLA
jgi:hypothetical protein